jgi:hypothetical protein
MAFARQPVRGRFTGSAEGITRQLLASRDYVIIHAAGSEELRMARIVVLGPDVPSDTPLPSLKTSGTRAMPIAQLKANQALVQKHRAAAEAARRLQVLPFARRQ